MSTDVDMSGADAKAPSDMASTTSPEPVNVDGWKKQGIDLIAFLMSEWGVKIEKHQISPLRRGGWQIQTVHSRFLTSKSGEHGLKFTLPKSFYSECEVIIRSVPSHISEADAVQLCIPAPDTAERFYKKHSDGNRSAMPLMKLKFSNVDAAKVAITRGVKCGYLYFKAEVYVRKRLAFCPKCKSLDRNHNPDSCKLRCGLCSKDHITKECPREQTNCVNCDSDDHSSVDCPRVLRKSQKQVKKLQKSFAQVVAKTSSPPEPKKTRQRKNSVSTPINPPPNSEALLEALHKLLILLKSLKVIQYDEQTLPTMLAAITNVITPSFESAGKKSAVLDLQRLLS
jgi:hypothetical protein